VSLIVEDGTGLATAESYVAVADADAYHTAQGHSTWTGATSLKEQALRRATSYVDRRYRWRFYGYRTHGRLQALEWPRMVYSDGNNGLAGYGWVTGYGVSFDGLPFDVINNNEIPKELTPAVCEAALRELTSPGSLTPDYVASKQAVRKTVGPITVEYERQASASAVRPTVTLIDEILAPILMATSSYSAVAARG
jgi:hypothetical protein